MLENGDEGYDIVSTVVNDRYSDILPAISLETVSRLTLAYYIDDTSTTYIDTQGRLYINILISILKRANCASQEMPLCVSVYCHAKKSTVARFLRVLLRQVKEDVTLSGDITLSWWHLTRRVPASVAWLHVCFDTATLSSLVQGV